MSDTINRLRDLADKSKDTAQACEAAAQILMSYDREDEFYAGVEHPELGETVTYLGSPYKMTETPRRISRRAPLIGEHNEEIYESELGLSKEEMRRFKQDGVV